MKDFDSKEGNIKSINKHTKIDYLKKSQVNNIHLLIIILQNINHSYLIK